MSAISKRITRILVQRPTGITKYTFSIKKRIPVRFSLSHLVISRYITNVKTQEFVKDHFSGCQLIPKKEATHFLMICSLQSFLPLPQ
jgi:hypothetical protein